VRAPTPGTLTTPTPGNSWGSAPTLVSTPTCVSQTKTSRGCRLFSLRRLT